MSDERKIYIKGIEINNFFQELLFSDLKSILIFKDNYKLASKLVAELQKEIFVLLMRELNRIRHKVAHVKENFSLIDLEIIKNDIESNNDIATKIDFD